MKKIILCVLIFAGSYLFAEDAPLATEEKSFIEKSKENSQKALDYVTEKSSEAKKAVDVKTNESVLKRQKYNYGGHLIYSPIDLMIPSKIGASAYMTSEDKNTQYELQYVRGSIPLSLGSIEFGKITDQRLSILKRNFSTTGNFNWYYGLSYISLDGVLGASLLSTVTSGSVISDIDLMKIQSLGFDLGLGHRWYLDNGFSFSVDWLGISQPVVILKKEAQFLNATTTNPDDQNNVKKSIDTLAYFPRLYFLKLSLGYSF